MVTDDMKIALHAFHLDTHHFTERIDCTMTLATDSPSSGLILRLVKVEFRHVLLLIDTRLWFAPYFFSVSLEALDMSEDIAVTVPVRCKRTTKAYVASTVFTPLDKSETTMLVVTHDCTSC